MKNKLANLPSAVLNEVLAEQKKQPGRSGDSTTAEFWDEFGKRALAKQKEIYG